MTNASGFTKRRTLVNKNGKCGSVGFDGSRYTRRMSDREQAVLPVQKAAVRKAYISPDAEVMLMPGAIERAAIDELFAEENGKSDKREHISLKEKIKAAAHRESEAYTMYGVETREIFTEEIEIDVSGRSAFGTAEGGITARTAESDISSRSTAAKRAQASRISDLSPKVREYFHEFAYRLNKLRLGKN